MDLMHLGLVVCWGYPGSAVSPALVSWQGPPVPYFADSAPGSASQALESSLCRPIASSERPSVQKGAVRTSRVGASIGPPCNCRLRIDAGERHLMYAESTAHRYRFAATCR